MANPTPEQIKSHMAEHWGPRQGWTTTKPTGPGWYWTWRKGDTEPEIICIRRNPWTNELEWKAVDDVSPLPVGTLSSRERFLGPLPVPEPPEG